MEIVERFERLARDRPGAKVAWTAHGTRDRRELSALAMDVSRTLAPVPQGVRVAISIRDGFAFLAALLAVWRHRSAAVLLDAADPRAPRTDHALALGATALLAGDRPLELKLLPCREPAPAGDAALVKMSSGSSGAPRGIVAGFAQLIADTKALERTMAIGDGERILAAVPLSFSYGLGSIAIPALWSGRELVLPHHPNPLAIQSALRHGAPTVLPAVPALLRALLDGRGTLPPSLRLVLSAGARLAPSLAAGFRQRFGLPVHAFYGASACGGICYDRTGEAAERGTVGTPVPGVALRIDGEGRVCVRSPAVAQAVLPDDGSVRGGELLTDDLGELRGPELVLLGRVHEVIDAGGHKVHPREVERVIAELPGVRDVAVLAWQPGQGRAGCAALVAAAPGVAPAAIRRHCVASLPPPKVPRRIVVLAALPRTARGKLQAAEAERLLLAGEAEPRNAAR